MIGRRDAFGLGLAVGIRGLGALLEPGDDVDPAARRRRLHRELLASSVVGPSDVGRVLYSWTRREQIAAIAARARTVDAVFEGDDDVGRSTFERSVPPGPLRDALERLPHRRRRFAWTHPWATVRGWGRTGEAPYGDQLLRLELHPEVELGWLRRGELVRLPPQDRLGAVYHEARVAGRTLREVVVLSGSLASWSHGTAAIGDELLGAAARLEELATVSPLVELRARVDVWSGRVPLETLALSYAANLAIDSEGYAPTPAALLATASTLREAAARQGPPMSARAPARAAVRAEVW